MNNPLTDILMAGLAGALFIILVKGGAAIVYFFQGLFQAWAKGDEHFLDQAIQNAIDKIFNFRLKSVSQRVGVVCLILFGLSAIIIANNTPSYRHYGVGFWFTFTCFVFSLIVVFGWFPIIAPFVRWLKTGELPLWINNPEQKTEALNEVKPKKVAEDYSDGIFPKTTKFYSVDAVPTTFYLNSLGLPVCAAWDVYPPREVAYEDIRQNGKEITREIFDEMIEFFLPEN